MSRPTIGLTSFGLDISILSLFICIYKIQHLKLFAFLFYLNLFFYYLCVVSVLEACDTKTNYLYVQTYLAINLALSDYF